MIICEKSRFHAFVTNLSGLTSCLPLKITHWFCYNMKICNCCFETVKGCKIAWFALVISKCIGMLFTPYLTWIHVNKAGCPWCKPFYSSVSSQLEVHRSINYSQTEIGVARDLVNILRRVCSSSIICVTVYSVFQTSHA